MRDRCDRISRHGHQSRLATLESVPATWLKNDLTREQIVHPKLSRLQTSSRMILSWIDYNLLHCLRLRARVFNDDRVYIGWKFALQSCSSLPEVDHTSCSHRNLSCSEARDTSSSTIYDFEAKFTLFRSSIHGGTMIMPDKLLSQHPIPNNTAIAHWCQTCHENPGT